jgi:Rrf2 family iron-sulfur cluster assembly transcriptional regulator
MNLLPRRALYAVTAVLDVALHARPVPVSAKALAARHGLAPRHLETVLQALVRGGILKGLRGPRGGYELARERRRVSVGDIVRSLGSLPGEETGSALLDSVVEPALREAAEAYLVALDAITVEDLCGRAGQAAATGTVDFTI